MNDEDVGVVDGGSGFVDCGKVGGLWFKSIGTPPLISESQNGVYEVVSFRHPEFEELSMEFIARRKDRAVLSCGVLLRVVFVSRLIGLRWVKYCSSVDEGLTVAGGALVLVSSNDDFGVAKTDTVRQLQVVYGGELFWGCLQ